MKILKASAGSGKTHRLSETYLDLLEQSDDRFAYRHILAVTFTNKATAEMKSRILHKLFARSSTDKKAGRMLVDILHDYGAFSVSTIDSFFQKTLKSFAREIGQYSDYQVELDRDSLIREAIDRILDGLTEDQTELLDWIRSNAMSDILKGKSFKIDDGLYEIGAMLKSEELRNLKEKHGVDLSEALSKDNLAGIKNECRKIIDGFEAMMLDMGATVTPGQVQDYKPPKDPESAELYNRIYPLYNTAARIDKTLYKLGLAGEFNRAFEDLAREKSVMTLDDSKSILKDIINGSDAPFIYEKIGVRYEHFLLDEFQDTSRMEWNNFLPLLKESEAKSDPSKVSNLIVGDVKQSIYRWRNSDWNLLGHEVAEAFTDADIETMQDNWRSLPVIVDFNNRFFKFAESIISTGMYGDVGQTARTQNNGGFVRINFSDDQNASVLEAISKAHECGAKYSDIAVLVRNGKEGQKVASFLIGENIPIISDDSLSLKSSAIVRTLVSSLELINDPNNVQRTFLARKAEISMPESFHSLVNLCEELARRLRDRDPDGFDREICFVSAFMDEVRKWTDTGGNDIGPFLDNWRSRKSATISSPESADAVRIITVHKSKGLEFPFVIFPYIETVTRFKRTEQWCRLESGGTGLEQIDGAIIPITISEKVRVSLFCGELEEERRMQDVDNLNIIYVALTRAVNGIQIIAGPPSSAFVKNFNKGRHTFKDYAEILYAFCGGEDYAEGEFGFDGIERKDDGYSAQTFPSGFPSFPLCGRLTASEEAGDFFNGEETGSARLTGIDLHKIMENVRTVSDLPHDIDKDDYRLLSARIAAHPQWFSEGTVRNEVSIFAPDGTEHRPDRVIINGEEVTIIDYKFGERKESSHIRQVRRYMELYRQMGFKKVSGTVWYVNEDEEIFISL